MYSIAHRIVLLQINCIQSAMILRALASNQPYSLISIPVVGICALLPAFLGKPFNAASTNFPSDYWFNTLYTNQTLLNFVVLGLIVAGAFLANYVFNKHEFLNVPVFVPGFIYTLSSACLSLIQLTLPVLLANVFILFALNRHLAVFRQQRALAFYFESAFWYGIAAVIFPPYILLIGGMFFAILITRAFHWRELLLPLIAFSIPFIYWIAWLYLKDSLQNIILFDKTVSWDAVNYFSMLTWSQKAFVMVCGIAIVASIPRYLFLSDRETNKSKSVKNVFLIMGVTIVLTFVVGYFLVLKWILLTLVIPMTFIIGYWFSNYRYSFIAPFVFYAFCLVAIVIVVSACGFSIQ